MSVTDIAAWHKVLGPMPRLLYHPPHTYPVTAPDWQDQPGASRPQPAEGALRLYVHVPFCRYKCSFCFYALSLGTKDPAMARYVDALIRELDWIEPGTPLSQAFVGGGTPTALLPEQLDRLLGAIFARTEPLPGELHTVETSPETLTEAHIEVLLRHGIPRVSMGIQTLDEGVLHGVHRRHSAEDALRACDLLAAAGLIVNVDLIYGLPGQTEASFRADLETLDAHGINNLSVYNLRVNEETSVRRRLREDEWLDLERLVHWRRFLRGETQRLGFEQYRWHCFRRREGRGANYERAACFDVQRGGYRLGVGLSARSKLGDAVYENVRDMQQYLERIEAGGSPVQRMLTMDSEDVRTHCISRSLGDGKALLKADWQAAFGQPIESCFGPLLERLQAVGLLHDDGERLELSPDGALVYDLINLAFFPARARRWLEGRQPLLQA